MDCPTHLIGETLESEEQEVSFSQSRLKDLSEGDQEKSRSKNRREGV